MKRLALGTLTLAAALALGMPVAVPHTAQAAALRPQLTARVLYKSTFSPVTFRHWHSTLRRTGWTVGKGNTATYNGSSATVLTAPVSIRGLKNFAVQAVIKAPESTSPDPNSLASFGLDVGLGGSYGSAVRVGPQFSTEPTQNAPQMWWGNDSVSGYVDDSVILPAQPLVQKAQYVTYRLEVRGTDYTLLIDNKIAIHFNIGPHKLGPQVGLFSVYSRMTVKSFSVTRLSAGAVSLALPAVKNLVLSGTDLLGLFLDSGHFYSNDEIARLNKTTPATIAYSGRVIGYEAGYSAPNNPPIGYVGSGVTAWTNAGEAASDAFGAGSYYDGSYAGNPNFTQVKVPELGSHATVTIFDATSGGLTYRTGIIDFSRGDYSAEIFAQGSAVSESVQDLQTQLIAWAKIVDTRVHAAG